MDDFLYTELDGVAIFFFFGGGVIKNCESNRFNVDVFTPGFCVFFSCIVIYFLIFNLFLSFLALLHTYRKQKTWCGGKGMIMTSQYK